MFKDKDVIISKLAPDHFTKMFSAKALLVAREYLNHEKDIVISVLQQNPQIKNVIVIGSGPAAYREIADDYGCSYVGIDPFYYFKKNDKNIFHFNCSFNEIQRSKLPEGPCLFLFWFNVMHYLKNPLQKLKNLVQDKDIIMYSGWSCKNKKSSIMESYFRKIYSYNTKRYQQAIQDIKEKNMHNFLIEGLSTIKNHMVYDNEINQSIVFYL